MSRRIQLAVAVSLALHLALAAGVVGSSLWRGWPAAPVDVEITGMRLEDVTDLPLGAPPSGANRSDAVIAPPPRAPAARKKTPATDPEQPKAAAKPERDHGPATAESDPDGGVAPPRPTSVRSYAPQGSRVSALMRVDRLRGSPYAQAVDELLLNLPDRRDLLEGTGVDLYRDIDALLIATPNPLDARVTFLAARHRLTDAAMRAALERGARATNRKLSWRTERGRPFAERRSLSPIPGVTQTPGNRDHRLILLASPHLVVITPPAYRSLILGGGAGPSSDAGRRRQAENGNDRADGSARADGGSNRDGGTAPEAPGTPGASAEQAGWAALLRRIDAEDGIMPPDAVAMVSASDLFSARGLRGALDAVPGTRGTVDDDTPASGGTIMGLPVPRLLTATLGIVPEPFADVEAEFSGESQAARWEQEWPALRRKLLTNPLVVLSGFSALIGRVTLERAAATLHVHIDATALETTRILQLLALQMSALRP